MESKLFDVADYLDDAETVIAYLSVVLESGDYAYLIQALDNVARSEGMKEITKTTGLERSTLYQILSERGERQLDKVVATLELLDIHAQFVAVPA